MKTLADLLKALEAVTNATDLDTAKAAAQSLTADLEEYDAGFKNEMSTKNSENRGLRTRLKEAEKAQGTMDDLKKRYGKVLTTIGLAEDVEDIDEALAAVVEKITNGEIAGKGKTELETQMADIKKSMAKLTNDLATITGERDTYLNKLNEETTKRQNAVKNQAILAALTEGKIRKPKELAKLVAQSVKVGEDDKLLFINDAGEELDFDKGVKGWIEANPEFVENVQKPGSGSGGAGGGGDNRIKATMAQMKDPDWYEKNRQAVMEDRVDLIDG